MRPSLRVVWAALSSLPLLLCASSARAGTFTSDGTFQFDPDAVARIDFETPGEGTGGSTSSGGGAGGAGAGDAEPALDGAHSYELVAQQGMDFDVQVLPESRTYRVSAWIRDSETTVDLEIAYGDLVDEVAALYPTGRITSDGWVEVANERIRIEGARAPRVTVGAFSAATARIDAIEIVPDGEISVSEANRPCTGSTDGGACGPEQMCVYSECRNVGGWVPPIPADRDELADYLENRLVFLFGPYLERETDLPSALLAIDRMRQATDRFTYWNGFMLAVRRLHDGHTSTSGLGDFVLRNQKPITACFVEGDADLSHALAPSDPSYHDVIVSHAGADHQLGLKPGDRLVSVDGQHPIAWARSLVEFHWAMNPTSNHRTFAEIAEQLRSLVARYAHEIVVIRCDPTSVSCSAPETISITDQPEIGADEMVNSVACDNRPLRHLSTSPPDHATGGDVYSGIVLDSNTTERIYGLEWESLYTTSPSDSIGAALHGAVAQWQADARGVILDHRSGNGGTNLGPMTLWAFTVQAHPSDVYFDRQFWQDEQPSIAEGAEIFQKALDKGLVESAGSAAPSTIPVALLITRDVSASDWLPFGMKGAPHTRIFGPFETNGAFSTRYAFGYWLGMSYVLATGDTFEPGGRTLNGTGVLPDEIVFPKQSDLLVGKDTIYEAALGWVRSQAQ